MQNDLFKIEVAPDKTSARLTVFNFEKLTKEMIFNEMVNLNIKKGVIIKNITLLFSTKQTNFPIEIAHYQTPMKSVQDCFKWHVNIDLSPKEIGSKIDFYDLGYLKDVKKDTLLFTMRQGLAGASGFLIDGTQTLGEDFSGLALKKRMQNIRIEAKEELIHGYSEIDGVLVVDDQSIRVKTKVVVNSDVDFKTGNLITKYADLEINGSTASKFKIMSPGSVLLKGNLQNSTVIAKTLTVTGKIMQGDNLIRVENLVAKEVHNRKNIFVDSCVITGRLGSSEIGITDRAVIHSVVDSLVVVKNRLEADIIGNDTSKNTIITLGIDKEQNDRRQELLLDIQKQRKLVRDLNIERVKVKNELDSLSYLDRKTGLTEIQEKRLVQLELDYELIEKDFARESKKEIELMEIHNQMDTDNFNINATLIVKTQIYHNTQIFLGLQNSIRLQKDYGPCKICAGDEGLLVIMPKVKKD